MEQYKSILTSRAIIGSIVAILSIAFKHLFDIDLGDQEALAIDIITITSTVFAIWGRIRATKKLKF